MKTQILTLSLVVFSCVSAIANDIFSNEYGKKTEKDDDEYYIQVRRFKSGDSNESVLTIENMYDRSTYTPSQGFLYIKEIGNGTAEVMRDHPNTYTKIVLNTEYVTTINTNAFKSLTNVVEFKISTNLVPPSVEDGAFPEVWATNCELTVPEGSKDAYKAAWGMYFYSINGEVIDHTVTGIGEFGTEKLTATVAGNNIILNKEVDVRVYSITGVNVYNGRTSKVPVSSCGIYIIKADGLVQKVVVR